jgi:hypothetical protein
MKEILLTIITILFFGNCIFSQTEKTQPIQRVSVPDSVALKLEVAYNKNAKNVNAGKNVFNLLHRKDFVFKNGIYSFQGQGPHFPRRIFIFNKGKLFIFENEGAFNPKGIIAEFSNAIELLNLTNKQIIAYLRATSDYLEQELNANYGGEIKK